MLLDTLFSLTDQRHFVIAYSGGLDSHVLLHAMSALRSNHLDITIKAVHVNHQLNPSSNDWAMHCERICQALSIPFVMESVTIHFKPGDSLEEQARLARYEILKKHVDPRSVLLTAHHLNDQAETFLLQALRGAGMKGLSAMPIKKQFGNSVMIRPFLPIARDKLEQYAHKHQLNWIDDDSNVDTRFNRNYLRHAIFPLLNKRFPKCMENFSRSARLMAEMQTVLDELAKVDYATMAEVHDGQTVLNVKALLSLPDARQRLVLREWFHQHHIRMPNEKHLKQIQKDVLHAAPDAHPEFRLGNCVIKRERSQIYFIISNQL